MVARASLTFRYTENGPLGLLNGKRAYLAVASGGTAVGSEIDFATGYLRHVLGFLGIDDVHIVAAVKEMHRQAGDLVLDKNGIARRGLLVRHLVLPGDLAGTAEAASFLSREVSADTYVNLMDQYHPCYRADGYPPLDRALSPEEYAQALTDARRAGLHRFDRPRRW